MTKEMLGVEIRATRKKLRMTQVEFSKAMQVTQSRLSKIEHGQLEFTATEYIRYLALKEKRR